MSLNIYLTFDGNCREAFNFYKDVFGGEFMSLETFASAPDDMPVADADKDLIMHVSLPIGSSVLMASDKAAGWGDDLVSGNNFSISVDAESRERCDELHAKLAEGGSVTMPMDDTFWGSYFGMCRDRFGISWMFSHAEPGQKT